MFQILRDEWRLSRRRLRRVQPGSLRRDTSVHRRARRDGCHDSRQRVCPITREWIVSKYAQIRVAARCDAAKCGRAEYVGRAGRIGAQALFHREILLGAARRAVKVKASNGSADSKTWIAADDRPVASEGEARTGREQITKSEEGVHSIIAKACRCDAGIIRFVKRLHAGNAAMHACEFRIVHGLAMFEACDACVIFWSDGVKCYA
jgi:hypothetical protein